MIKAGQESLKVVKLQLQLRNLGFYKGLIDGVFDAKTLESVKEFQDYCDLVIDGLVGKNTNRYLEQLSKDAYLCLFIHYSATLPNTGVTAKRVVDYHMRREKWSRPGYAYIVEESGRLVNTWEHSSKPIIQESEYTFGVRSTTGLNRNARHICYIGGLTDKNGNWGDTRNEYQKAVLDDFVRFQLRLNPNIIVLGHNKAQNKPCPGYDVKQDLKSRLNIPDWNLYHGDKDLRI